MPIASHEHSLITRPLLVVTPCTAAQIKNKEMNDAPQSECVCKDVLYRANVVLLP